MLYQRGLVNFSRKRRESLGETTIQADHAIEPRLTKSSTHARPDKSLSTLMSSSLSHSLGTADDRILWDPRIDVFEVLRAKVNGITRTMHAFHVQELFQDDLHEGSLSSHYRSWNFGSSSPPAASFLGHRRVQSQNSVCVTAYDASDDEDERMPENLDVMGVDGNDSFAEDALTPSSPSLTALFLTTNSLIHSRLDELSETASIHSSGHDVDSPEQEWRQQFLQLTTTCITHSEKLESLSAELLGTERRVRELLAENTTLREAFQSREKAYGDRLRDCEEVAQQQLLMISSLEELMTDIESTMQNQPFQDLGLSLVPSASTTSSALSAASIDNGDGPWDFKKKVADMVCLEEKDDMIHKTRWEVGMFVGGGVGTGHVIHVREEGWLHGIEEIIAGAGHAPKDGCEAAGGMPISVSISPILRKRLAVRGNQCVSLLSPEDRQRKFVLLSRDKWIPDSLVEQCQFKHVHPNRPACTARFTFWNRRHHCRKCGHVVCGQHGSNRLPLFSAPTAKPQWSRICDECFYTLMLA